MARLCLLCRRIGPCHRTAVDGLEEAICESCYHLSYSPNYLGAGGAEEDPADYPEDLYILWWAVPAYCPDYKVPYHWLHATPRLRFH